MLAASFGRRFRLSRMQSAVYKCLIVLLAVETAAGVIFASEVPPNGKTLGLFVNNGPATVDIRCFNSAGDLVTNKIFWPGEIDCFVIEPGEVRAYKPSASAVSGALLSTCSIPKKSSQSEFYDRRRHCFYFAVNDGRVRKLRPKQAVRLRSQWGSIESKQ